MARAWSTGARAARQAGGRLEVPLAEADVLARAQAARAKMQRLLSSPTPFSGDDGAADPAVTRALDALDAGSRPRHLLLERLWSALAASRVIVPVEAHALPARTRPAGPTGPGGKAPTHPVHTADASRDAATLAVELPDGHIALPVFTSAGAMLAWRADVRPVPVEPRRAAVVAYEHTDQLWVLDPGTRDLRLPRPAVVALAGGEDWVPSWRSTLIQDELTAQLSGLEGVTAVAFAPGQASELRSSCAWTPPPGAARWLTRWRPARRSWSTPPGVSSLTPSSSSPCRPEACGLLPVLPCSAPALPRPCPSCPAPSYPHVTGDVP